MSSLIAVSLLASALSSVDYPGPLPGLARATCTEKDASLHNDVISMRWVFPDERLRPQQVTHRQMSITHDLAGEECFKLILNQTPIPGSRTLSASELWFVSPPRASRIASNPGAIRAAERFGGWQVSARLASDAPSFEVDWRAELRDGANYIRQEMVIFSGPESLEITELVLLELPIPDATVTGEVDGSPVVAGSFFFAAEHPASRCRILGSDPSNPGASRFCCFHPFATVAPQDATPTYSSVVGVFPPGQLRRGFLFYTERERAQPYRPFLHYNNGSEIGCVYWRTRENKSFEEATQFRRDQQRVWLSNIHAFGQELVQRRHVILDSFAHDFEWDDETTIWRFHEGYPDGFTPAQRVAAKYQARVGVWLSPSGGYNGKHYRLEHGPEQGLETNPMGFSIAGPRYYARVRQACVELVRRYGVNYFKFDGFAAGNNQPGPGAYISDAEAVIRLIEEIRKVDPAVFINPSTGSWPSPFWLRHADSIWRQGKDTDIHGKGSDRQKWITYRDAEVYHGVVQRAPLYPISSLMIHGIYINHLPLFGNPFDAAGATPTYQLEDLTDEIRSFFATGVNLQELYIAPDLMASGAWDVLAEAAKWARRNADVLTDTHWIGGDPGQDQVYGWASWNKRKGILSLRNPSDKPTDFSLDIAQVFELPGQAAENYLLTSPWTRDTDTDGVYLTAGKRHRFSLQPFQVLVYDATPQPD